VFSLMLRNQKRKFGLLFHFVGTFESFTRPKIVSFFSLLLVLYDEAIYRDLLWKGQANMQTCDDEQLKL